MRSIHASIKSIVVMLACLPVMAAYAQPGGGDAESGWVLVTPRHAKETVLLDSRGKETHVWATNCEAAGSARLHPDGSILRLGRMPLPAPFDKSGLRGGRLQIIGWDGKLEWDFLDAVSDHFAFGDAIRLPNGNVLTAVLEYKSRQECEALGRAGDVVTDAGMYFPGLMEFTPNGKASGIPVWKWSLAEHLYQGRHPNLPHYQYPGEIPGRVDVGMKSHLKGPVWLQPLEIDYHAQEDLILMVMGGTGEVWAIDHSTTMEESASSQGGKRGRGGDILLRWRGPKVSPGAEQKSVVLSAEWSWTPNNDSQRLGMQLLRMDGSPAVTTVDEIKVDVKSFAVVDSRLVLQDRTVPTLSPGESRPLLGNLPSGLSWNAHEKTALLTEGLRGSVRLSGERGASWSYQNTRGQILIARQKEPVPGQECCGQQAVVADNKPQSAEAKEAGVGKTESIQAAPLGKARAYAADFIKVTP